MSGVELLLVGVSPLSGEGAFLPLVISLVYLSRSKTDIHLQKGRTLKVSCMGAQLTSI